MRCFFHFYMRPYLLLLFISLSQYSFSQRLSENSEISLITLGPAAELWSFAGHSVLRVRDPQNAIDVNFNYGMFDFRTDNFYLKFLRGTLPYQIGAFNYRDEFPYWQADNRSITEQVLNLTLAERQKIYDLLVENYQPQNRKYLYKFFYDNCSTRIRDVLQNACGDSLQFSKSLNADLSFRDWINIYSDKSKNDWSKFGMDLLIGVPADETTNAYRAMYIPDNMMFAFDSAQIYHDSKWQSLIKSKTEIYKPEDWSKAIFITPIQFFTLLFVVFLLISWFEYKKNRWFIGFDKLLFGLTGLFGWILIFLWFFTDHGVTQNNFNLVWCLPLFFPIIFWLKNKKIKNGLIRLFFLQMILIAALLIFWKFIPQKLPLALIPLTGIILMRCFIVWKKLN